MKHCKEGKIVSAVKRTFPLIFLVAFLISSGIKAQIPVNGFCKYKEIPIKENYSNIFSADFNLDGYRDLFIYSSSSNKYSSIISDKKNDLVTPNERFSPVSFSNIHSFGNNITDKKFFFLSRKTRQAGISLFSRSGSISIQSKIKLNGFPSSLDVADIDGDGKPEGLVSGISLNGLSIIKEKSGSLREIKIDNKKIFSASTFIDLDYDSYNDIAAVEPISNSIIFFNNNGSGLFTESRSIGLKSEISEFKSADVNSDGFMDLVFLTSDHLEVMLGDSVSSFQKKIILDTPVKPDKYAILDFNKDGYNDIAFINFQTNTLYISFAKGANSFYPPVIYLQKNGLIDLTGYLDRTGKKLAVLSSEGKIYLINNLGINDDTFSISLGVQPTAFTVFDYLNDKFKDFCFIDEGRSLNIILSERRNLFRQYFSIPLLSNYTNVSVDDSKPRIKTFYCYSNATNKIEIIRMNFDERNYQKQILYTDGLIEDFKFFIDRLIDRQNIFALIKKNNQTYLQDFELRDFLLANSKTNLISSDADNSWLTFGGYKEIYSVKKKEGELIFVKTVFDKKIIDQNNLLSFNLKEKDNVNYSVICLDELINRSRPVTFWLTINKKSYLYSFNNRQVKKYPLKLLIDKNYVNGYNLNSRGDEVTFCFYNAVGRLHMVKFIGGKNSPVENDLFVSTNINNYLVSELNGGKTFLIYAGNSMNTLTFEKIK